MDRAPRRRTVTRAAGRSRGSPPRRARGARPCRRRAAAGGGGRGAGPGRAPPRPARACRRGPPPWPNVSTTSLFPSRTRPARTMRRRGGPSRGPAELRPVERRLDLTRQSKGPLPCRSKPVERRPQLELRGELPLGEGRGEGGRGGVVPERDCTRTSLRATFTSILRNPPSRRRGRRVGGLVVAPAVLGDAQERPREVVRLGDGEAAGAVRQVAEAATTSARRLDWSVSSWVISSRVTGAPSPLPASRCWALMAAVAERASPELPSWVEIWRPRTSMP